MHAKNSSGLMDIHTRERQSEDRPRVTYNWWQMNKLDVEELIISDTISDCNCSMPQENCCSVAVRARVCMCMNIAGTWNCMYSLQPAQKLGI